MTTPIIAKNLTEAIEAFFAHEGTIGLALKSLLSQREDLRDVAYNHQIVATAKIFGVPHSEIAAASAQIGAFRDHFRSYGWAQLPNGRTVATQDAAKVLQLSNRRQEVIDALKTTAEPLSALRNYLDMMIEISEAEHDALAWRESWKYRNSQTEHPAMRKLLKESGRGREFLFCRHIDGANMSEIIPHLKAEKSRLAAMLKVLESFTEKDLDDTDEWGYPRKAGYDPNGYERAELDGKISAMKEIAAAVKSMTTK